MTHEEFANACLRIKKRGSVMQIPCCGNCEHYILCRNNKYNCYHPQLKMTGQAWIETKPEDFCNYYKERNYEKDTNTI